MFTLSIPLGLIFARYKQPSLLAPLLIGTLLQIIPFISFLIPITQTEPFLLVAELGIISILLTVGLQLNVEELRNLSYSIVLLASLNIAFSTVLGYLVLSFFGYSPFVSLIVSTALATVAETTICPILDELGVIKSRVSCLILGTGVIDDVVEILIASAAVLYVGASSSSSIVSVFQGLAVFVAVSLILMKGVFPFLSHYEGYFQNGQLLSIIFMTVFVLTAVSISFNLGILLGAIVAGLLLQRYSRNSNFDGTLDSLKVISYFFLGPVFFFSIGSSISLSSLGEGALITVSLLLVNLLGKYIPALIVGRQLKFDSKAIIVLGMGLSAKFSMGIIPVQILFSAGLINVQLFSSFVAVCTITTLIIPFVLGFVINKWRSSIT